MTLEQEVIKPFFRRLFTPLPIITLYVITFATIYYNGFDSTDRPVYYLVSQIIGWSIFSTFYALILAFLLECSPMVWVSIAGLTVYTVLNMSFAWLSINHPDLTFIDIYPTIESFAMTVFSTVGSLTYFRWFDKTFNKIFNAKNGGK